MTKGNVPAAGGSVHDKGGSGPDKGGSPDKGGGAATDVETGDAHDPAEPVDSGSAGSARDAFADTLNAVIREAISPEAQAARNLMLRRLALQGDVIPSRLPAPRNITELGGYLNLLEGLGLSDLRTSLLSSVLGVAAPSPVTEPVAPVVEPPPALPLVAVPTGASRGPASIGVRADLAGPLAAALARVRAAGGVLPLWTPPATSPPTLPPSAPGAAPPAPGDVLFALGRRVLVAPDQALRDPTVDPVVLGRVAGDPADQVQLAVRVAKGRPEIRAGTWEGLARREGALDRVTLGSAPLAPLSAFLADTGFAAVAAAPTADLADLAWATLTNAVGLLPHRSRLGDELVLSWTPGEIGRSRFAGQVDDVWDGTVFVSGPPAPTG